MNKIPFKDLPDTTTPVNATNLNLVQDNVEDAIEDITITLDSAVSTSSTNGVENQAITNYVDGIAATIPEVKTTQTTSDTATYSCTYINNNAGGLPSWTSLGTQTGTTPIALPSDFNELTVHLFQGGTNKNYVFKFIKSMLSSTPEYYVQGGYISAQNCSQVAVEISTTQVAVGYAYNNGANDVASTSTIKVWYR